MIIYYINAVPSYISYMLAADKTSGDTTTIRGKKKPQMKMSDPSVHHHHHHHHPCPSSSLV